MLAPTENKSNSPRKRAHCLARPSLSPLGATWDGEGVNFALYSEHAEKVELCLFDMHWADARPPRSASRAN
jgi:pullulanase/glycogen debranching enzyme